MPVSPVRSCRPEILNQEHYHCSLQRVYYMYNLSGWLLVSHFVVVCHWSFEVLIAGSKVVQSLHSVFQALLSSDYYYWIERILWTKVASMIYRCYNCFDLVIIVGRLFMRSWDSLGEAVYSVTTRNPWRMGYRNHSGHQATMMTRKRCCWRTKQQQRLRRVIVVIIIINVS